MAENNEGPVLSEREVLEQQISEVSDRIEKATDQGYSATQEDYDKRKNLQDRLYSLIHPGTTTPVMEKPTPSFQLKNGRIDGYGVHPNQKMGPRAGQIIRRGQSKR